MGIKSIFTFGIACFFSLAAIGQPGDASKTPVSPTTSGKVSQSEPATGIPLEKSAKPLETPKMVIENSRYEFGAVVEGTSVVHEFLIQNKGSAPLKIEKVKTG